MKAKVNVLYHEEYTKNKYSESFNVQVKLLEFDSEATSTYRILETYCDKSNPRHFAKILERNRSESIRYAITLFDELVRTYFEVDDPDGSIEGNAE